MIDLSWPKTNGLPDNPWFRHASLFTRIVAENPGFWNRDFRLKYLLINLDTRDDSFTLRDRDNGVINPDEVMRAIHAWRRWK